MSERHPITRWRSALMGSVPYHRRRAMLTRLPGGNLSASPAAPFPGVPSSVGSTVTAKRAGAILRADPRIHPRGGRAFSR